jgi:hypothetical protein
MNVNEIKQAKDQLKESINDLLVAFTNKDKHGATSSDIEEWIVKRNFFIDDLEDLAIQVALDLDNNTNI